MKQENRISQNNFKLTKDSQKGTIYLIRRPQSIHRHAILRKRQFFAQFARMNRVTQSVNLIMLYVINRLSTKSVIDKTGDGIKRSRIDIVMS